jgi:Flp pilus assembly pilin Flp
VPRLRPGSGGGQGIVEYGLIIGLGALLAVVILVFFGGPVSVVLEFIARLVDEATHGG